MLASLRMSVRQRVGSRLTLTRAFLQEDDLGLREEVAPSDGHLFSATDQTAGQAGLLNLG